MGKKKAFIILLLIVLLGFFLRAYSLGERPFVTDEFLDMNATYGYFKTGKWVAWDFNLQRVSDDLYAARDERAWAYRWQVAQLFRFFQPTEAVARSVSVFWGIISIIGVYFFGSYFTKKKEIGLIAAFLFAVGGVGIVIDRTFRMYAMFFPVFLFFLWAVFLLFEGEYAGRSRLVKYSKEKIGLNIIWLFPVLLLGLLSFHILDLAVNVGVIVVSYLVVMGFAALFIQKGKRMNKYLLYLILLLVLGSAAYVLFPDKVRHYMSGVKFFKLEYRYLATVTKDYTNSILVYFFIFSGCITLLKSSMDKRRAVWLITSFFSILITSYLLWDYIFGERLIFFILPVGTILLSAGIYNLAEFLKKNSIRYGKNIASSFLLMMLIILPNYYGLAEEGYIYGKDKNVPDYEKVFKYIQKHAKKGDILITKNFRSYYYAAAGLNVVDLGNDNVVDVEKIESLMQQNNGIWGFAEDDRSGLSKEAMNYIKNNFKVAKTIGGSDVYHWKKTE